MSKKRYQVLNRETCETICVFNSPTWAGLFCKEYTDEFPNRKLEIRVINEAALEPMVDGVREEPKTS